MLKCIVPTYFEKLNLEWDADSGAPEPRVHSGGSVLTLTFFLNSSNPKFRECDRGEISFRNCWRYRLGYPNDEGWYQGHCRFRCLAQDWGDFYEVTGDLLENGPKDWIVTQQFHSESSRHFLFYFKDETFECDADGWSFKVLPVSAADCEQLQSSALVVGFPRTTLLGVLRELILAPIRAARMSVHRK
jgi:hypothetical protein